MAALSPAFGVPWMSRAARVIPFLPGVVAIAYGIGLLVLSQSYAKGSASREQAQAWLAGLSMMAGVAYLIAMAVVCRRGRPLSVGWICGTALVARLILCAAPPLLETDFYRYLWDGAVTVHGVNPFGQAPGEVLSDSVQGEDAALLQQLAAESGEVLERINHPDLRTIYPPIAQAAFAVSSLIDPFGITAWRLVLLVCDALTMLLIACVLRELGLPMARLGWYAWNPVLLSQVYLGLHMDVLVLPLVVGALLLGLRGRHGAAAMLCVAGSAVKIWPIVLVPLLLRPLWPRRAALVGICVQLALLAILVWIPVFVAPRGGPDGFLAYRDQWQSNDGFFRAGIWLTERALAGMGEEPWHSHKIMRIVAIGLLLAVIVSQSIRRATGNELARRFLIVIGAVFLLSPTEFPWYWLWCLPLLAIRPSAPLLLYVVLLPLYELQYRSDAVYWMEHAPVWGLLVYSAARSRST
ncbi:MAG: DUF2029 domain-containing protein [Planctomycetes bacterium]|nr:DUF2029 domain-containing protein [Planctomycetota bacterium]